MSVTLPCYINQEVLSALRRPSQISSSASHISAGQDIKTKGKGSRKFVILAVVLTVLILLVLALVGVVVFVVLSDNGNDNCDGSTSRAPIPPTANPLITAAPSTLVMTNTGMYCNVEFKVICKEQFL